MSMKTQFSPLSHLFRQWLTALIHSISQSRPTDRSIRAESWCLRDGFAGSSAIATGATARRCLCALVEISSYSAFGGAEASPSLGSDLRSCSGWAAGSSPNSIRTYDPIGCGNESCGCSFSPHADGGPFRPPGQALPPMSACAHARSAAPAARCHPLHGACAWGDTGCRGAPGGAGCQGGARVRTAAARRTGADQSGFSPSPWVAPSTWQFPIPGLS